MHEPQNIPEAPAVILAIRIVDESKHSFGLKAGYWSDSLLSEIQATLSRELEVESSRTGDIA
jgi:hypothetical protein